MDLDVFVKKFSELFFETDPSEITCDTEFRNLDEWSSLMSLGLIAMVDEEFGKSLKGEEIRKAETVKDLYNAIKDK